ncbi:preprotein translocase subunit SecG [Phaeovulum sp.]|uniref:preprotein translocase subunit SecG n=1 Tax=Phaeovulum sp. TaxID=2934796 RepID=UPI0039E2D947
MENVILTVHLILALLLIGVVLLQRSEGGGLGMGGGGGGGGVMSGRQAANALSKLTWVFAAAFIITSVALTSLAARKATGSSVVDKTTTEQSVPEVAPVLPDLTLPAAPLDAPLTPPPAN